jgi:hypothetical protein
VFDRHEAPVIHQPSRRRGSMAAWRARQLAMPVIGYLHDSSLEARRSAAMLAHFTKA